MSEITRFNEDAKENQKMLDELKEIGNDLGKVVAYANSKGYKISVEQLKDQIQQGGELSEESLDNVTGGISAIITGIADVSALFVL